METDPPIQAGDIVTRGADSRRMRVKSVTYRADEFLRGEGRPSDYLYARCEWDELEPAAVDFGIGVGPSPLMPTRVTVSADYPVPRLRLFVAPADRSREAEVTATPEFSHLMAGVQADPMAAPPRMALSDWLAERDCPALAAKILDGTACVCGGRGGEYAQFASQSVRTWMPCRGLICKRRLSVEPDGSGRRWSRQL